MARPITPEDALEARATWQVMYRRGLTKHCPRCGGGHLYVGWFRMKERCPTCGFKFEREAGFFVGAYFINFAIAEGLLFVLVMAYVLVLAQNPDAGFVLPIVGGVVLGIIGPMVFYPFARTIWSAIDLASTPLELDEIVAAQDFLATEAKPAG